MDKAKEVDFKLCNPPINHVTEGGTDEDFSEIEFIRFGPVVVALGAGNALGAGEYPEKPINLIVHAGAGGGSDIFSRTLAAAVDKDKLLPQPIVVENKPGGSGGIAFAYVAGKKRRTPITSSPRSQAF